MVTITDKTKCSGCTACANICPQKCIDMVADSEGFLYPKIDESRCIKCNLCSKVCPVINNKKDNLKMPDIYACYAKNKDLLLQGSSGNIFGLLATAFINKGGVAYGAAYADAYNVQHLRVDNVADLHKLQKSKYLQSNLGKIYQDVKADLTAGKRVLFSGTGCQIEGLQNYLIKEYDNLVTVDLICHGVPSPKVWQKYLEGHKIPHHANVDFRSKEIQNDGKMCSKLICSVDNKYLINEPYNSNKYIMSFLSECNIRPCCYDCKFKKIHRQADITLGDFWGVKQTCPDMYNPNGTSVIFIHSEIGRELFDSIKDLVECKPVNLDQAIKYNPSYLYSVKPNKNRAKFFKKLDSTKVDKLVKKYCEPSVGRKFLRLCKKAVKKIIKL